MDSATAEQLRFSLRGDNAAMDRALAELDERISAWSNAVESVHSALVSMSNYQLNMSACVDEEQQLPSTSVPQTSVAEEPVADEATDVADGPVFVELSGPLPDFSSAAEQPPAADASVTKSIATMLASSESGKAEKAEKAEKDEKDEGKKVWGHGVGAMVSPGRDGNEAQDVQAPTPANTEREEQLLAELDEGAAKKVRVMRRMLPDVSIEELIEKYGQAGASGGQNDGNEKDGKGRSWWRLGT